MNTQRLVTILAIFAFNLYGVSSAHAEKSCDTGWELMTQQSEGYQIKGCAGDSEARQRVELASWGRIVYSRSDRGSQELVCDNNGDQPVDLIVASAKADTGHDQADTPCAWSDNIYRCEGDEAPSLFCSTSIAVAANTGSTPTATTSVSTRDAAGMFPFNYKEDIIFGVRQMTPEVSSCRGYLSDSESNVELSWVIRQSGEINRLRLRSDHERPGELMQCLNGELESFRFKKHQFAMQYWEHTFRL